MRATRMERACPVSGSWSCQARDSAALKRRLSGKIQTQPEAVGLGGVLGRGTEALPKRNETADVSIARTRINAKDAPQQGCTGGAAPCQDCRRRYDPAHLAITAVKAKVEIRRLSPKSSAQSLAWSAQRVYQY
jgi:hypothetical protein